MQPRRRTRNARHRAGARGHVPVAHLALVVALAIAGLYGCASAPSRFYAIQPAARATGDTPMASFGVLVGPVSVPAAVDRPEFVVQVSPHRVELDEFNRWATPIGDGLARAVAVDLATLLGTPRVATAPLANFEPAYRVTIDVQRFDSILGEAALLDAVWVVRPTSAGTTRSGRTIAREAAPGESFDALAAAHSRAIAQLSTDVAAAIRSASDERR